MLRILIQQLAIFLLPILLYAVYFLVARQRAQMAGKPKPSWQEGPWFWLVLGGLVLTITMFVLLGTVGVEGPGGVFESPRVEDGKIRPGRVVR